jgi:DNA repair exonuclease SbcCD ATPase subunit
MVGILSVRGVFASNFPDADALAERVHGRLYKALYEGAEEKLQANLSCVQTLFLEDAALRARVAGLEAAAEAWRARVEAEQAARKTELAASAEALQDAHGELEALREKAAEAEARPAPGVGAKRARTEADWGAESEIVRMLLGQLQEKDRQIQEKDQQIQEKDRQLDAARAEAADARVEVEKARAAAEKARARATALEKDNEAKVEAHEKLRRSAKATATTMGFGTRAFTELLEFFRPLATTEDALALLRRLERTVRHTHRQEYLTLRDTPGMRAHGQTSLGAWLERHGAPDTEDTE